MDRILTITKLKEESGKIKPYFTLNEIEFLGQYAPTYFSNRPLKLLVSNQNTQIELNQKIFDVVVKLDISIARNANLETLIEEKKKILNPILFAFGLDQISSKGDLYQSLYEIKNKGLKILEYTSPQSDKLIQRTSETINTFDVERNKLIKIFGDIPMMIYGSSLIKTNPSDIDSMVFPKSLNPNIYRKLKGKYEPNKKPPLSFVITPLDYLTAFAMSETQENFNPKNSKIINGKINVPIRSKKYLENLRIHQVASEYIRLRNVLTKNGLQSCVGILPRINAYLKKPKFMYFNLGLEEKFPEPIIETFNMLPNEAELINAFYML